MSDRSTRRVQAADGLNIVPKLLPEFEAEVQMLATTHRQLYDVWYDVAHQQWLIRDRSYAPEPCQYFTKTFHPARSRRVA